MEQHRERVRKNDPVTAGVTTVVIRSYEKDVRALLDFLEDDAWSGGPVIQETVKRVRRMVGYTE